MGMNPGSQAPPHQPPPYPFSTMDGAQRSPRLGSKQLTAQGYLARGGGGGTRDTRARVPWGVSTPWAAPPATPLLFSEPGAKACLHGILGVAALW